jgi:hypothetical protein
MTARTANVAASLTIAMALLLLASSTPAQDRPAPPEAQAAPDVAGSGPHAGEAGAGARANGLSARSGQGIERRVRSMTRALNLNLGQQRQLRAILIDQREQTRKLAGNASMSPEDRIGALRAVNQETARQIRSMLDDDQKRKYGAQSSPSQPAVGGADPPGGSRDSARPAPDSSDPRQ